MKIYSPKVSEVFVDMEEKSMVVTPEMQYATPNLTEAFEAANKPYADDPEGYFKYLANSHHAVTHNWGTANYSVLPGNGNKAMLIFPGFSDIAPKRNYEFMYGYTQKDHPSIMDKIIGAPNRQSQMVKSATTSEVLKALGHDMTVLTIYNILPTAAFTFTEQLQMARGDFSALGKIVETVVDDAQDRLHGRKSETQFDKLHGFGMSLGSSYLIGAAAETKRDGRRDILSVTVQEPILAQSGVFKLLGNFLGSDAIGGKSTAEAGKDYRQVGTIHQSELRAKVDRAGNEPLWLFRAAMAGLRLRNRGMTHPQKNQTIPALHYLAEQGVPLLAAFGENSGMSVGTENLLPKGTDVLHIRSVKGGQAPHLIDEHEPAVVFTAATGIQRATRD